MKDSNEISVEVGGRGRCRTLTITCDPTTITELAALIYTQLQNVQAKPVPPHDVSEILIYRESPADAAHENVQNSLSILGCLGSLALGLVAFSFMIIGFVATVEWLRGGWGN